MAAHPANREVGPDSLVAEDAFGGNPRVVVPLLVLVLEVGLLA